MSELLQLLKQIEKAEPGKLDSIYERHGVDRGQPVSALEDTIRRDGSNGFANLWRGEGLPYRDIVADVAGRFDVEVQDGEPLTSLEQRLLAQVASKFWSSLSEEERRKHDARIRELAPDQTFDSLMAALKAGGAAATAIWRVIAAEVVTQVITQALVRLGLQAGIKYAAGLAGVLVPGVNILLAASAVNDLFAAPSYRRTVPTVIELALLRLQTTQEEVP